MNSKHKKTLELIFSKPPPNSLEWGRIESLLVGVGCELVEGRG